MKLASYPARILFLVSTVVWANIVMCQAAVHFADPQLEQAVRDRLQKPAGDLTDADLLQLTSLYAPNYRIADLSGLEAASNLTFLNVTQNDITNAAALAGLPQLTYLDLSYNYVRDLSPVLGLTNLTSLFLAALSLETAPSLTNMPGLGQLGLANNHICDPAPLQSLTSLRFLDLAANPISSVGSLCGITNLETLSLGDLSLTNANDLSCFTHLVNLDLRGNLLTVVNPLAGLTNLQSLDLSRNPLSDYSSLAGLTNLLSLTLNGNAVRDWTSLAGLTNLVDLYVSGGSLTNLDWLTQLHNLSSLCLPKNSISDISALAGLTNLVRLELSENSLTNYTALAALTNLQVLYLDGNSITDLSFTAQLRQLVGLSLVWNCIADLTPLAGLTNLSWLEASFNLLTNIAVLRELPNLSSVSLNGNLLDLTVGSATMGIILGLQGKGGSVYYEPQLVPPQILVRPQWLLPAGQKSWLTFLLPDGAYSFVHSPTVIAHSSDPELIPETTFVTAHSSDYYSWELAVTPAADRVGTATLTLAATNYAGLWTNVTVEVQVAPPMPLSAEFLDSGPLAWSTRGRPPWFGQTTVSHDGLGAAQSGAEDSWLQTTVSGPGTLRFWFKLESAYYYGNAQFSATAQDSDLHGYEHLHRSGEVWQQQIVGLPAGEWVLKWSPSWDSWDYCGLNTVWLDQVSFVPGPPACWLEPKFYELATGERLLYMHGVLGRSYDVEVSSDLRNWALLTRLTCENFEASFTDWKVGAIARFYRARMVP